MGILWYCFLWEQCLTIATIWANLADNKSMPFFLFFSGFVISQIDSYEDKLHKMSNPIF